MADPLMTLLAGALKLWIRTRCDQLGSLELTLHGSAFTLMSGRLQGVSLIARDVGFKGLPLQHVQLRSGPITVDLNVLSPGQMLALQHPFQVEGEVSISGTALNDALLAEPWRWLGDSLAEQLMGLTTAGWFNHRERCDGAPIGSGGSSRTGASLLQDRCLRQHVAVSIARCCRCLINVAPHGPWDQDHHGIPSGGTTPSQRLC
jgi:hypothetical protein